MFDKLKKRNCYAVEGLDGVFIRLLRQGEKKTFGELTGDAKGWFFFGTVLVESNGDQSCPRNEGESTEAFIARVAEAMDDVDDGVLLLVRQAYEKLMRGEQVPLETIAKN